MFSLCAFIFTLPVMAEDSVDGNLIEGYGYKDSSVELSDTSLFTAVKRWACYAVYPGRGTNVYYKGTPQNSESFVRYMAVTRCNRINPGNRCYIQECRYGHY